MFGILIKIDETLPWIELKGIYETQKEARRAVEILLSRIQVKIVTVSEKDRRTKLVAMAQQIKR